MNHRFLFGKWTLALALGLFAFGAMTPAAQAQSSSVIVLGIRSLEGDDDFARNLTGALRHAASQVAGWSVSDREVTLSQMALAHGCGDPDASCMASIAGALQIDRVIYGDVRRTSVGEDFDFSLNLHIFSASTGQLEHSVAETIPSVRRDIDDLREPARRYLAALSGAPRRGNLTVAVNVPGAEVFVDGESAGVADFEGHLLVNDIPAGTRSVRVVADGHRSFATTISVEAYGESRLEAELSREIGGGGGLNGDLVAGTVFSVAAVALAALWVGSWAEIQFNIGSDDGFAGTQDWADARALFDESITNFCDESQTGGVYQDQALGTQPIPEWVRNRCNRYNTWMPLQFVFGGSAAVAAGFALYFLVAGASASGGDEPANAESARIQVAPILGPNVSGFQVAGHF